MALRSCYGYRHACAEPRHLNKDGDAPRAMKLTLRSEALAQPLGTFSCWHDFGVRGARTLYSEPCSGAFIVLWSFRSLVGCATRGAALLPVLTTDTTRRRGDKTDELGFRSDISAP